MNPCYNKIPTKLSETEFNEFILPHLKDGCRGPKPKISQYKIFNYILYLIHTGCQWYNIPVEKDLNGEPEIHYTRIFRHFQNWLKAGCFDLIFESSIAKLIENNQLDISVLHGDGTTTAAKKGAIISVLADIKESKAIKLSQSVIEIAM